MKKTRAQIIVILLAIGFLGLIASAYITLPGWMMTAVAVSLDLGIGGLMDS